MRNINSHSTNYVYITQNISINIETFIQNNTSSFAKRSQEIHRYVSVDRQTINLEWVFFQKHN